MEKNIIQYKFTKKEHFLSFIISVLITIALWKPVNVFLDEFINIGFMEYPTPSIMINFFIYILILLVPVMLIHESIHAIFYKMFGGKVKIGFKGIYAYTQEVSELSVSKHKFVVILLMPLFLMALPTFFIHNPIINMFLFLNILGSCGDIFMALLLIRYEPNCNIIDRSYGFDIVSTDLRA